jgi:hypothetical protein
MDFVIRRGCRLAFEQMRLVVVSADEFVDTGLLHTHSDIWGLSC